MTKTTDAIQPWIPLKGHTGLQYRDYGNERSYRFRQKIQVREKIDPSKSGPGILVDFFGVMDEPTAIRIAAELRENRANGAGPQTYKEMQGEHREQAQQVAIKEKKERKRIIAAERLSQENTVGSFWDKVHWPQRSQRGSVKNNNSMLYMFEKWIRPTVGDIPLTELTFSDVEQVLKNMADYEMAPKSIKEIYIMLQSEWNYAQIYLSVHNQINLPVFPGKILKLEKINNEKTCWLERNEAFLLIKTLENWRGCCKKHGIHQKGKDTKDAYGMTILSLFSGLRFGDIARLTWRDVQTVFAYARTPKSGRAYGIHLDIPIVREMLEKRRAMFPNARPEDRVFLTYLGNPWASPPQEYEDVVDELGFNFTPRRKDNHLEKIDFHALRHTFASWLAMAGTDLHTIMVLMDHKDIKMTLRYARLNPAYTRKPVQDLAEGFAREHKILADDNYAYIEVQPVRKEIDQNIFMLEAS